MQPPRVARYARPVTHPTARSSPGSPTTLVEALADTVRADPGRPLVTFYDEATGERVELSGVTFDNWVSKIANLYADELGIDPGDGCAVRLPTHWLAPAIVLGCWAAGLVLARPAEAAVQVVGPAEVGHPDELDGAGVALACSLRPLGGRFTEPLPPGWLDFAVEVPSQPDALLDPRPAAPHGRAVSAAFAGAAPGTHEAMVAAGRAAAERHGLASGGRLATDLGTADLNGLVTSVAAPLAVGGSLVLIVNADPDRRRQIATAERVTCVAWAE